MAQMHNHHRWSTGRPEIDTQIDHLLEAWNVSIDRDRFREMVITVLKFYEDKPEAADVRQFNTAIKEMRYANKVFAPYHGIKNIAIFGSARTHETEPAYLGAEKFARLMQESGFMVITGGGGGIMAAAQAGAGRERSFALNISLPFEQMPNSTIAGDRKLINFKYFFTRKLNFVKNSHAIAAFPGGFGTMDESFEALTLIQTGKAPIVPILLLDHPEGNGFWNGFMTFLRDYMLKSRLVSKDDFNLITITTDLEAARDEVLKFYNNFHSYRYVRDTCVIRMQRHLPEGEIERIQDDFSDILRNREDVKAGWAMPEEINEPLLAELPRLCLPFTRTNYGRLRRLIDRINEF